MSGLTRKQVYVDRNLSVVLGANEGDILSYADIQKGLHKYIKDNDLKNLSRTRPRSLIPSSAPGMLADLVQAKRCRDCGGEIPSEAAFCDMCGAGQ
jgi:hypothetical protein